jgi:hypothetical protein
MLVGFPAGGNLDFVARLLVNELKAYSSTFIVETDGRSRAPRARWLEIQRCGWLDNDPHPRGDDSAFSAHL